MAAMQLNALVRKAVSTAKGVRIRMDRQQFEMTVLSSILWFKVRTLCQTQHSAGRTANPVRCCGSFVKGGSYRERWKVL